MSLMEALFVVTVVWALVLVLGFVLLKAADIPEENR